MKDDIARSERRTRDQFFATQGNPVIRWCQQPQIGGTHVGGVCTCASATDERNGGTAFIWRVVVNIAALENAGVTPQARKRASEAAAADDV